MDEGRWIPARDLRRSDLRRLGTMRMQERGKPDSELQQNGAGLGAPRAAPMTVMRRDLTSGA